MPTKLNRAGNQQNYVPKGNGDASGEYGDTATGSNKHFQAFKKPDDEEKKVTDTFEIDEDDEKVTPKRKIYTYTAWYSTTPRYITEEEYNKYKNDPAYSSYAFDEYEIEYDEEKIEKQLLDNADKLLTKNPDVNYFQFQKIGNFNEDATENIDRNAMQYFFNEHPEFKDKFVELKRSKIVKANEVEIENGKKALEKLPKIEGEISISDNVSAVNKANYDRTRDDFYRLKTNDARKEYNKYHENCQKCAQAFELRMRGYNVEALDRPVNNTSDYNDLKRRGWELSMYVEPEEGFEAYGFNYYSGVAGRNTKNIPFSSHRGATQREEIKNIVKKAGKGARYECVVAWQDSGAHVFNVINDDGEVKFIDAQSGLEDASYYFDSGMIKPNYTMLVRTDNLEITGFVDKIVKGK